MLTSKRLSWLLPLILFCLVILIFFPRQLMTRMVDFEVNYKAAQRLLYGETLYRVADGHYQFKYPPAAAFLYLPLTFLPLNAAKIIWFMLTLTASLGVLIFSSRLVGEKEKTATWIPVISGLILARFFLREISLGQINSIITFLLLLMIIHWPAKSSPEWSNFLPGIYWGIASALKPYSLIFLPLFILRRATKSLFSGLAILFIAFIAPALFYGLKGNWLVHQEWISHLSRSTPPLLTSQDNVSLFGLLAKWGGSSFPVWETGMALVGLLALAMLGLVLFSSYVSQPVRLEGSAILLLIPLVSPLGWDYTFLSAAPAISFLLANFSFFPRLDRYCLVFIWSTIGLMLYDLLGRQLYTSLMKACLPTLLFLCLFSHLVWLRWKKRA